MDGALEHMRQFGFCDQVVRETVKELLKVGLYLFVFCFCQSKDIHGIQSFKDSNAVFTVLFKVPICKQGFFIYKKSKRFEFGLAHL